MVDFRKQARVCVPNSVLSSVGVNAAVSNDVNALDPFLRALASNLRHAIWL